MSKLKTAKYILGLSSIFLVSQLLGAEETEHDIAELQICFLKSMYRPAVEENYFPFFFPSQEDAKLVFWEIADTYLKNKGIPEKELRSEEFIRILVSDLRAEMKETTIVHKAAFLAGLYQKHGTAKGFTLAGRSNYLGLVMEVFGFREEFNVSVNPGYPGNTEYEFEGIEDRENFKSFMNKIYSVVREDRPISDMIDPFSNPWATSIDARIYKNPTSRLSKSR